MMVDEGCIEGDMHFNTPRLDKGCATLYNGRIAAAITEADQQTEEPSKLK
jgi:hypothetical protein